MGQSHRYYAYRPETPEHILKANKDCKAFGLQIPVSLAWKQAEERVLIVLEYVDSADIKSKRLGSSHYGTAVKAVFDLAESYVKPFGAIPKYATALVNFNFFKTFHIKNNELRNVCDRACADRIRSLIAKLKPTKVIIFGDNAAYSLLPKEWDVISMRGWPCDIEGIPYYSTIDLSYGYSKVGSDFTQDDDVSDKTINFANLLGFASRCVANALLGRNPYAIEVKVKPIMVNSIGRFDRLLDKIGDARAIALDSETASLARVTNRILTLQFSIDSECGYVLPLMHPESPFNVQNLKYIHRRLREFFGSKFDPLKPAKRFLIGQNLKFDLTQLRHWLEIHSIYWPVWDIMAGEYCLDENLRQLNKMGTGADDDSGIFALSRTALNYGCNFYAVSEFSKKERGNIINMPLEGAVVKYCAADVQIPYAIRLKQVQRAKNLPYKKGDYQQTFSRLMLTQMSNIVHILSKLEHRGAHLDIRYLMKMKSKEGPLEQMRTEILNTLRESKAVRKVNQRLLEDSGVPKSGLFGNSDQWVFSITKPRHKQMLYIEELGLEPLSSGISGAPSIDANFMAAHREVPEVDILARISELEKLRTSYVNKFTALYHSDPDFKKDMHLRANYLFLTVTGRSMSADPNLQQIPSRKKQAKLIKRMFAAQRGSLTMKMDYSSHEIRMWGIISNDKLLCDLFTTGRKLRQKYRATEDPKYKELMDTVGDVHKVNVEFFEGTKPKDVTKEQRTDIKEVVFGSIYGRSAASVARKLNKEKEQIEKLMAKFFGRYVPASKWLSWAKKHSVEHGYVYSPIGRVRHMYAQLYDINALTAGVERRGSNAPIQGCGADIGHTAAHIYDWHIEQVFTKFGMPDAIGEGVHTMVHDSMTEDRKYQYLIPSLQIHQWVATLGCEQYYNTHFGMEFPCHLEVDFEIGADDSRLRKWDWSDSGLKLIIEQALADQTEIYPDLNVKEVMRTIYEYKNNVALCRYLDKNFPILGD